MGSLLSSQKSIGNITRPSFNYIYLLRSTSRAICHNPSCEQSRIPRLHVYTSGTGEFAYQALTGAHTRDKTAGSNTLHDIFTAPGY